MTTRLDADAILDLWEAGQGRYPYQRAVQILERCGWPDAADLPLAERDRALLALHGATFRPELDLVTDCPDCGARLELELATADLDEMLHLPAPSPPAALDGIPVRDPTTRDLDALTSADDPAAELRSRLAGGAELPKVTRSALTAWIDLRLSEAEVTLNLTCGECGAGWSEALDIPSIFWFELEAAARGVLRDVADLARAFAWSEAAILALGPGRRQAYLDLARAP